MTLALHAGPAGAMGASADDETPCCFGTFDRDGPNVAKTAREGAQGLVAEAMVQTCEEREMRSPGATSRLASRRATPSDAGLTAAAPAVVYLRPDDEAVDVACAAPRSARQSASSAVSGVAPGMAGTVVGEDPGSRPLVAVRRLPAESCGGPWGAEGLGTSTRAVWEI